jgi:hypothetical protein
LKSSGLDIPSDLVDDMRLHAERLGGQAEKVFERIVGAGTEKRDMS